VPITPAGAAADVTTSQAAPEAPGTSPPAETPALSSSTLAELYFEQGFFDKAVEVYEQLLEKDPRNERARARLIEIKAHVHVRAPAPDDPHAARRHAIERTIDRLERMLAAVRRE
jgi:DNA-binding SARP family transcriptional activator